MTRARRRVKPCPRSGDGGFCDRLAGAKDWDIAVLKTYALPGSIDSVEIFREVRRMHNEFTAVIERDGEWFVAYCPEISGAGGQGKTEDEARDSLAHAIALILEDRPA